MTTERTAVELSEHLSSLDPALTPEELADAVLASPAVVALQRDAWDQGYRAGVRYSRSRF